MIPGDIGHLDLSFPYDGVEGVYHFFVVGCDGLGKLFLALPGVGVHTGGDEPFIKEVAGDDELTDVGRAADLPDKVHERSPVLLSFCVPVVHSQVDVADDDDDGPLAAEPRNAVLVEGEGVLRGCGLRSGSKAAGRGAQECGEDHDAQDADSSHWISFPFMWSVIGQHGG
ncbi:hypothetical protein SDC9_54021 [bioreactor metagenome]|uniref:Uncharacterized protein n=1 Tax=bioreactor metagenome TaxID=1076179 RepID=A0A644X0L5_9ZZZZ